MLFPVHSILFHKAPISLAIVFLNLPTCSAIFPIGMLGIMLGEGSHRDGHETENSWQA